MVVLVRGSAYRLSDYKLAIEEQLQTHRQTRNVEEVRLLATFTLWIDSDLENDTWHSINIVVLAGRVIVDKECKWNLSGHDSVVTYSLARNGQEPGENGADGKHGYAGESGGNVAIVTDFIDNAEKLTVWMNGGRGSSGQSGGNGAKGRDGEGITIDQLKSDFESPLKIFAGFALRGKPVPQRLLKDNEKKRERRTEKLQQTEAKRKNALLLNEIMSTHQSEMHDMMTMRGEMAQLGLQAAAIIDNIQQQVNKANEELERLKGKTTEQISRYHTYEVRQKKKRPEKTAAQLRADSETKKQNVMNKIEQNPMNTDAWKAIFELELTAEEINSLVKFSSPLNGPLLQQFEKKRALAVLMNAPFELLHVNTNAMDTIIQDPSQGSRFLKPTDGVAKNNWTKAFHLAEITDERIEETFDTLKALQIPSNALDEFEDNVSKLFKLQINDTQTVSDIMQHQTKMNESEVKGVMEAVLRSIFKNKINKRLFKEAFTNIDTLRVDNKVLKDLLPDTKWSELKLNEKETAHFLINVENAVNELHRAKESLQRAIGYFAEDAWAANKHQHLSCVQSYERFVFCVNFRIEVIKSTLADLEYCPLLKENWRCFDDDFKPQSVESRQLTAHEQIFINALHDNRIDLRRHLVNEISSTRQKKFDWSNVLQYGINAQTTDACLNEMIDQKTNSRALLELLAYTNRQPISIFARNENDSLKHIGNFFHLGGEPQFAELADGSLVEMTVDGKKFILELTRDAFVKHMQKAVSDNPHLVKIAQSKHIEQTVTNICCDIYKRLKTEIVEKIYRNFEKTSTIADVISSTLNLTQVSDRSKTSSDVPLCDEFIFNVRRELKRQDQNLSTEENDQLDGKLRYIHQEAEHLNQIGCIEQQLLKLKPVHMGPNMLLNALEQIFECNGMQMSLDELRVFIKIVLSACTIQEQHPDLFTSIILTTPQNALVDQLILHVFENQSKQLLQNRWELLQHLRNLHDLSLKKVLLQKTAESTEMPSEESFSSILELLKHYENKDAQHLLQLGLIDWAGSLRENYWKEQLQHSQISHMPELDHCAFYFVHLDSFYDRKLVEKLLYAIEGIAPYIDMEMLLKFLYQLYSDETELCESVTIDLITLTEKLQKSSSSVGLSLQQMGVQSDGEQVDQLKERLGLVARKERTIAQIIGMMCTRKNAQGIHSLLDTIQLLIQDHFSISHGIRDEEDLINMIEEAKRTLPEAVDKQVHLLQVVNAAIWYKRGYELRDTQKIVILASLKNQRGLLSQVATGEGKTLIIMSIAIITCMLGEQVDIITSCSVLAQRDAESAPPKGNSDIYKLFGIAVGHNCIEDTEKRAQVYNTCDVVYGDLSSFQRDYLLDTFYGKNILGRRRQVNVIVDEVDSMLLDNGNNMLYLSHDIPGMDKLQSLLIYIWKRVNRPIKSAKEFIEYSNKVIIQAIIADLHGLILHSDVDSVTWKKLKKNGLIGDDGRLQKQLRDYSEEVEKLEIGDQSKRDQLIFLLNNVANRIRNINIPNHLFQFAENHLDHFINSAKNAIYMEHGVNYVVDVDRTGEDPDRNPKIIIINQDTGTDESSSQWHNALHQFLQLKHGCKLTMIGLKAVFISNVSYFKLYQNIYGLSGTLGSAEEKQLLSKLYNVDLIRVPTCKPKNFHEEGPMIASYTDIWMDNLFAATCKKLQENRSVLIIAESVKDVEYIEKQLKQRSASNDTLQNVALIEGFQQMHVYKREHEEFRFVQGNDELASAQVIVATNLAGRGTDIKLCKDLIAAGGLHVIVTFLPNNSRIEEQAYGRSARCGDPGTGQLVIMNNSVDENTTFMAKIFQLKNMRDAEELIRLKSIIKHYEERIIAEEKCFNQFQLKYEDIKHRLEELKCDQELMRIILNSSLDAWAYWLNEQSDIIDNAATKDPKNKKLFDNLDNFLKPINSEVKKWNKNPLQFLKLAVYNLEHKRYEYAGELLMEIQNKHPYFEAEALFYQAFLYIRQNGAKLNSTTTIEFGKLQQMLSRSRQLFVARIDQCSRDQAFVQSFKTETNRLIHIEAFTEQQQTICQIYNMFINSINELQGQAVSSNAFISRNVNDLLAKDIFWHLQENAKIITDYMVSPYLEESNKTDLTLVALDYGVDSETLWNVVSNRKNDTINSECLEEVIALPSIEDFWVLLISKGVLVSEEEFFEVDTSKLDQLQLDRKPPIEQFRHALDIDLMDGKQILMYHRQKQQMEQESKVFCSIGLRNEINSIDANIEESLKRYGILQLNRIATINIDRLKSPLTFPRFDSFKRDNLTALGISLNEADRLLSALVISNVLEESSSQGVYQLKGELNLDEVSAVYQEVVAVALNNHFAYQIKLRQLRERFDENEQSEVKTPLSIKLASHPHASLLFDLVDKGIAQLPKINNAIFKNSKIEDILSSLRSTMAIEKDILSDKATSEAIESTLSQSICVLIGLETPDCEFTHIIELMKLQPGSSLTEVAWFSMNGCDKLISTIEKKYSTKMWINMHIIISFAVAQIVAGAVLEIFTAGAGTFAACALVNEGINDLLFVGSSLASGYCKTKDYWQYKKVSMLVTAATCGLAAFLARGTVLSRLGYKVVGPAGEVGGKKIIHMIGGELIKELGINRVLIETAKRVGLKLVEGVAFGMTRCAIEYVVHNRLNGLCDSLRCTITSNIDSEFANHQLKSTVLEAYNTLGHERTNQLIAAVNKQHFEQNTVSPQLKMIINKVMYIATHAFSECSSKLSKMGKEVPGAQIIKILDLLNKLAGWYADAAEIKAVAKQSTAFLDSVHRQIRDEIDAQMAVAAQPLQDAELHRDQTMLRWKATIQERSSQTVTKHLFKPLLSQGSKMLIGDLDLEIKRSYRKQQETIVRAQLISAKQKFDEIVSNDKMRNEELKQEQEQYHKALMKLMSKTRDASLFSDVLREGIQMDVTCVQAFTDVIHKMMCQIDSRFKFKGIKIIIEEEDGIQRAYESGEEATHIIILKLENNHFTVGGEMETAAAGIYMNNCLFHALAAEIPMLQDVFFDSNAFRETLANVISMDDHMKFIIRNDRYRGAIEQGSHRGEVPQSATRMDRAQEMFKKHTNHVQQEIRQLSASLGNAEQMEICTKLDNILQKMKSIHSQEDNEDIIAADEVEKVVQELHEWIRNKEITIPRDELKVFLQLRNSINDYSSFVDKIIHNKKIFRSIVDQRKTGQDDFVTTKDTKLLLHTAQRAKEVTHDDFDCGKWTNGLPSDDPEFIAYIAMREANELVRQRQTELWAKEERIVTNNMLKELNKDLFSNTAAVGIDGNSVCIAFDMKKKEDADFGLTNKEYDKLFEKLQASGLLHDKQSVNFLSAQSAADTAAEARGPHAAMQILSFWQKNHKKWLTKGNSKTEKSPPKLGASRPVCMCCGFALCSMQISFNVYAKATTKPSNWRDPANIRTTAYIRNVIK
uniref:Chloroplast protein-transporting ATPase n=1 Tax=Plectus sambesii TaxID=2011161 RepID=A0A914W311_9BILA